MGYSGDGTYTKFMQIAINFFFFSQFDSYNEKREI